MRGWLSRRGPRWSPIRFARRSALGHRRGQTLALVAVSALITACTAFAPVYDRAMQQALVDTLLAHANLAEKTVTIVSEAQVDAGGATEAQDPRGLQDMVPADVAARLGPPVLGRTASVTAPLGLVPPTGPLVWRQGACEHIRLLSGTCPTAPGQILVSRADVATFGLSIGSTPTVNAAVDGQQPVALQVVGTYEPRDTEWWQGQTLLGISGVSQGTDPTAAHDAWLTTEETFVDSPILPGETSQTGAPVRAGTTGVDEVLALGDRVSQVSRDIASEGLYVVTDLDVVTKDVRAQTRQAHRTVPMLMAPMAVLALYVLWLVLGAATQQRRGEVAVARLRGRGPAGAVGLLLIELLPVLLVGVVPGAAVALLGGALARALLPGSAPFEIGPGFAAAVTLAVAAVVLTTVAAAVRVAREPLDGLVRRGQPSTTRWALGALDAFLIAAVGTGVLAFVTGSLSGPFALAGPALLALLAGLVLAHVTGPAASASGRSQLRRGRLVAGMTLLETGRRRDTRAVIAVITVATALAVFAGDALAVGARNRTSASEQDAGAPIVLRLDGHDLDGVREALRSVDASGRRATPVLVAGTTLAVEPDGFRRIAFFPRGAPTAAQWRAIAPPDKQPVTLTGTRMSLTVQTGDESTAKDALGTDSEVDIGLVATTSTGALRTIPLGPIARSGGRTTLVARDPACAGGCRLAAVQITAAPGVQIDGELDLSDLRVDGRPVDWGSPAEDWNTTEGQYSVIRPSGSASDGVLHLAVSAEGIYPADVTPAWVPTTVPALLPDARRDPLGVEVTGLDGVDRPARSVGRVVLVPTMPRRSALVDLDSLSRGVQIGHEARVEVWLVDDPALVAAVQRSLRGHGITVDGVRRFAAVRQSYQDTVATWSLALGAVVGAAAILIALLVLLVLAVTGWRERSRDLAVLRLSGAARRTTRRLAVWAQQPAILLAIAAGVVSGLVGGALALPDVPLFSVPLETPVVDLTTSWPAVLLAAAVYVVVLPLAAALAGRQVARRAHLERVKETV